MASSAPVPIGSLVMDVKLTGQNYRDWAFSFKMLLRSVGLASHLTDEPPVAAVNDKAAQDWSLQDDRVMAAICLNTVLSIRLCLEDYKLQKQYGTTCKVAINKAAQPFAIHFVRIFIIFNSRTWKLRSITLPSLSCQTSLHPWYPNLLPYAWIVSPLGLPETSMIRKILCLTL